jgi:hypothetical protein
LCNFWVDGNLTAYRLEHNWQHNYFVDFLKYQILPEDGLQKTGTFWGLKCIDSKSLKIWMPEIQTTQESRLANFINVAG